MFAQVGATYSSSSFTQTGNNPSLSVNGAVNTTLLRFENPAYGLVDAAVGVGKDAWTLQRSKRESVHLDLAVRGGSDADRPRVLGLQMNYKF